MRIRFKTLGATFAAAALIAAPTAASAGTAASSLSVAKTSGVRAGTATTGKNKIAEGSTATLVSVGILAALVVTVLVATGGDDSDSN